MQYSLHSFKACSVYIFNTNGKHLKCVCIYFIFIYIYICMKYNVSFSSLFPWKTLSRQLSVQVIRQTVPQLCHYRACHSRVQEESWRHGYGAVSSHTRTDCLWLSLLSVCYKGSLVIVLHLLFCVRVRIVRTYRGVNRGWGCSRKGCSRRYIVVRGTKEVGTGVDHIKSIFMTCIFVLYSIDLFKKN